MTLRSLHSLQKNGRAAMTACPTVFLDGVFPNLEGLCEGQCFPGHRLWKVCDRDARRNLMSLLCLAYRMNLKFT